MEVVSFDPAKEKARLREFWERLTGYYPRPSSPDDNILDLAVYVETILADWINKKYRAGFLSYARGEELDLIARDIFGIERLGPVPAVTMLRFYLSSQTTITIPAGTRVATKDMRVVFKTDETVTGNTQLDVRATAEIPGSFGNGYLPGEVSILLDQISGVERVENLTVTAGGADEESDEHLRERCRLSMERFSTAGPKGAYIFHAKSAHPRVGDVSVFSPSPGQVKVLFLLDDGSLPSPELVDLVSARLNDERVRPLTDSVSVGVPTEVSVDVSVRVHISDMSLLSYIRDRAEEALNSYLSSVQRSIGKDLVVSKIHDVCFVHRAVEKVEVLSPPQDVVADRDKVIRIGNLTLEVVKYAG